MENDLPGKPLVLAILAGMIGLISFIVVAAIKLQ